MVSPGELRPARWWYWIAGALGLLGAIGGVVTGLQGLGNIFRFSDVDELAVGESARVDLGPEQPVSIYALERLDGTVPVIRCVGVPVAAGSIDLVPPDLDTYVFNGSGSWRSMYDIDVSEAAPYRLECDALGGLEPGDRLGLAPTGSPRAAIGQFGRSALFGLFGLGAAIVVCLVVAIGRSNHKRRLLAQRRPPPPPPPVWYAPPTYPVPPPPSSPPPPRPPSDFVPPG